MNNRPEDTVDVQDVDVVVGVIKDMLSEKWITMLMPESEIQRLATNIVRALKDDQAHRK